MYAPEDEGAEIVEGDDVASNSGYAALLDWVDGLDAEEYPELRGLAEAGASGDPAALEGELARALHERPGEPPGPVLSTAARLLALVRDRPEGTAAVAVTDGTAGAG